MVYLNAHPVAKPKSSIGRREASCSRYDLELVADRPAFHPCPVGAQLRDVFLQMTLAGLKALLCALCETSASSAI